MNPLISQHLHRSVLAIGLATTLLGSHSFAQTETPPTPSATTPCKPSTDLSSPQKSPCRAKHHTDTSISLGALSNFTIDRIDVSNSVIQGTAPSAGTLGTFRQTLSVWLGYSVNLGYARVSEQYRSPNGYYVNDLNIGADMYESSITYIAHTPVNKHFSLFGDVGGGLLTFLPVIRGADALHYFPYQQTGLYPSVQARPTGVFGSGIDLHLTPRFDIRVEYRGLVYNNPDFRTDDALSKRPTLTSEPTFSLVYHFHKPKP